MKHDYAAIASRVEQLQRYHKDELKGAFEGGSVCVHAGGLGWDDLPYVLHALRIAEALERGPSDGMVAAGWAHLDKGWGPHTMYETMTAEMLKEIEESEG